MKPNFPQSEFILFQRTISRVRLEAYRTSRTDSHVDLISKYLWNVALSESLYTVLHHFEVSLRNSLYQAIARLSHDNWLVDADSTVLCAPEENIVIRSKASLSVKGKPCTTENIITDLNLGFWISLCFARYESERHLYPGLFKDRDFLPYLPRGMRTRSNLSKHFNPIWKLRNRVFHHEPIWNMKTLNKEYSNCLDAIQWMSPMLYRTTQNLSRFPEIYEKGSTFYRETIESSINNYNSSAIFSRAP